MRHGTHRVPSGQAAGSGSALAKQTAELGGGRQNVRAHDHRGLPTKRHALIVRVRIPLCSSYAPPLAARPYTRGEPTTSLSILPGGPPRVNGVDMALTWRGPVHGVVRYLSRPCRAMGPRWRTCPHAYPGRVSAAMPATCRAASRRMLISGRADARIPPGAGRGPWRRRRAHVITRCAAPREALPRMADRRLAAALDHGPGGGGSAGFPRMSRMASR